MRNGGSTRVANTDKKALQKYNDEFNLRNKKCTPAQYPFLKSADPRFFTILATALGCDILDRAVKGCGSAEFDIFQIYDK